MSDFMVIAYTHRGNEFDMTDSYYACIESNMLSDMFHNIS
jgi:hypothetical protein